MKWVIGIALAGLVIWQIEMFAYALGWFGLSVALGAPGLPWND